MTKVETFYPIVVALVFNVLDLLTGIVTAVKNKDIQSSKLRDGLFKKVGFILCYVVAYLIDNEGYLIGFQIEVTILPAVILYTCSTELVSIIENIHKLNPDIIPEKLLELFHVSESEEK